MRPSVIQSSHENKTCYLSFLAILSSLAVIYLHYNGVFWQRPTGGIWVSANIIEAVFYFAVPIFFMISGCTLMDYKEKYSTKTFFIKRIRKTVLPFLAWSGMACLYEYLLHPIRFQGVGLGEVFFGILDATYMPVYWFFMPLFSIYLCMPLLTDIKHKKETFTYVVLIGILMISTIPLLDGLGLHCLPRGLSFPICGAYLIYPLLGYLLHHTSVSFKWRMLIYGLGLLSLLAHIGVTTWMTPIDGPICSLVKGYTKLPALLYASAIFLFAKYELRQLYGLACVQGWIEYFKPTTFGIYLLHIYGYYICNALMDTSTYWYRLMFPWVAFLSLAVLIRWCQKIKLLTLFLPR